MNGYESKNPRKKGKRKRPRCWHTRGRKGNNPMKLYQIRKLLSREAAETAAGYILPAVLVVDIRAGLFFFAALGGASISGFDAALAIFFAMQIVAISAALAFVLVRLWRGYRAPKRYGVIQPETIRQLLEGRR